MTKGQLEKKVKETQQRMLANLEERKELKQQLYGYESVLKMVENGQIDLLEKPARG